MMMINKSTIAVALATLLLVLASVADVSCYEETHASEVIPLSTILPKLQAIHEDAQTLLIKNSELKAKILLGLQAQNEAKLLKAKQNKLAGTSMSTTPKSVTPTKPLQAGEHLDNTTTTNNNKDSIDYFELEEFNKWVDNNLDYAVRNTQASIDALKEEAHNNNGNVDYSEQAIRDGIEGVKYWRSAVIFQDKTMKHEKYEDIE